MNKTKKMRETISIDECADVAHVVVKRFRKRMAKLSTDIGENLIAEMYKAGIPMRDKEDGTNYQFDSEESGFIRARVTELLSTEMGIMMGMILSCKSQHVRDAGKKHRTY